MPGSIYEQEVDKADDPGSPNKADGKVSRGHKVIKPGANQADQRCQQAANDTRRHHIPVLAQTQEDDKPGEGKRTHEGDKVSNQKSLKKSLPQHHCNPPHGDEDGNDRHRLNPLLQEDPCQHCGDQGASTENKEGVCDRGEADG